MRCSLLIALTRPATSLRYGTSAATETALLLTTSANVCEIERHRRSCRMTDNVHQNGQTKLPTAQPDEIGQPPIGTHQPNAF